MAVRATPLSLVADVVIHDPCSSYDHEMHLPHRDGLSPWEGEVRCTFVLYHLDMVTDFFSLG